MDLNDEENFLYSDNLIEKAKETGKYKEGEVFNFYEIFSKDTSISEYYGVAKDPENSYRKWHSIYYFSGEDIDINQMKYSVKPNMQVTPREIMDLLSLTSENTKYDLSKMRMQENIKILIGWK